MTALERAFETVKEKQKELRKAKGTKVRENTCGIETNQSLAKRDFLKGFYTPILPPVAVIERTMPALQENTDRCHTGW
jgi:hypothetical protein